MVEAVRTTASPAAIWTIVVVAVVVLAFWLTAVLLADRYQVRTSGRWRMTGEARLVPGETQVASGDAWADEGLAGQDAGAAAREPIGARAGAASDYVPEGEIPTRVDLPAQSAGPDAMPPRPTQAPPPQAQPARQHTMPAQRSGDADRAERSYAGPPPDEDDQGQPDSGA